MIIFGTIHFLLFFTKDVKQVSVKNRIRTQKIQNIRHNAAILAKDYVEFVKLLMENKGIVVTRQTLIDSVWGYDYVGDTKTLDVHIKRLRAKIEPNPETPEVIVTIRGLGYKLVG